MASELPTTLQEFRARRVVWPILASVVAVGVLFYQDFDGRPERFFALWQRLQWTSTVWLWLLLSVLLTVVRVSANTWQLRTLADDQLSWRRCLKIILLWEFFAAVSPAFVGGFALALYIFIKEGLSFGRSAAMVFTVILFDTLFYLSVIPVAALMVGTQPIFAPFDGVVSHGKLALFGLAYAITAGYALLLALALFVWPNTVSRALKRAAMWRRLKPSWQRWGVRTARELHAASAALRGNPLGFWLRIGAATVVAWSSRYLILNCVLAAFAAPGFGWQEHVAAFSRQAVLFLIMMLSPTPGSSGIAEAAFGWLFNDLTPPGLTVVLAVTWRLISYYPYLFVGIPVMSAWIRGSYSAAQPARATGAGGP